MPKEAMRTEASICLLCQKEPATKRNSHIVPKFLTKSMAGLGNAKRYNEISTSTLHLRPKPSQDSPKEDFILCPSCEKYFEIIETYVANQVHYRLRDSQYSACFPEFRNSGGIRWKVCADTEPIVFRLFLYSILWRCAISSVSLFSGFSLSTNELEALRDTLIALKVENKHDLLNRTKTLTTSFPYFPFVIFTADAFDDPAENFIYWNPDFRNPYILILNEYFLIFSFSGNKELVMPDKLNNSDDQKIKIGFVDKKFWKGISNKMAAKVARDGTQNSKKLGQVPWIFK